MAKKVQPGEMGHDSWRSAASFIRGGVRFGGYTTTKEDLKRIGAAMDIRLAEWVSKIISTLGRDVVL